MLRVENWLGWKNYSYKVCIRFNLISFLFRSIVFRFSVIKRSGSVVVHVGFIQNAGLDKSNMDNYRAITISPVISKVFESYLLCTMQIITCS